MNGWLPISEMPKEKLGAKYWMILDGTIQVCTEITESNDRKRWFWGDENGAYPIDEIEYFKAIDK